MASIAENAKSELFTWEWARGDGVAWDSVVKHHCGAPVWVFECEQSSFPRFIEEDFWADLYKLSFRICPICGWRAVIEDSFIRKRPPDHLGGESIYRIIRRFTLNDPQLGLDELGAHLRRRFADVYSISPRRFEQLVADVYKQIGYDVILTPQTRDGGRDMVLLGKENERIIVECKRYSSDRKIGVGIVNSILGVQLALGERRARIVTTSTFTFPAQERARSPALEDQGYTIELIDAEQLLRLLSVYNTDMPSLDAWATEAQIRASEARPEPAFRYDNWPIELGDVRLITGPEKPKMSYADWLRRSFKPNE